MTPNGTLTEDRVWRMIIEAIEKYDVGNSLRHQQTNAKMDQIMALLWKVMWGILLVGLTAAAGLATDVIVHLMGKG